MCACMCAQTFQLCPTLCDAPDRGPLAPLSMGFSRQEYWSGLPCLLVNWLSVQFSRSGVSCDSLRPLGTCQGVCSMPDFPVHYQLLKPAQTHVHWVGNAIQPSYPLSSPPPPPAFNLSQHQGLLRWVSSSHQVAKVLEFQLQHQSFQWIFRTDLL